MSTLAVEQRTLEGFEQERTLDEVIVGVWRAVRSHRNVECPVCHGEMTPEYGAQALPIAGRCRDCGASLN